MESEYKTEKKKFNKKLVIPLAVVLAIGIVTAAYLVLTLKADITVNEAFEIATEDASFNAFTGGKYCVPLEIHNQANVPIKAQLTFVQVDNPNGVIYDSPIVVEEISAESTESPEVCVIVDNESPEGIIKGQITVERVK